MELIVVIAVVGALAGALVNTINIRRQQDHANDGVLRQNLSDTAQAIETYYVAERSYPDQGANQNPLTGSDSGVISQYLGIWPEGYVYNENGNDFSIYVEKASTPDNYFKYSSVWQELRECGEIEIDTVDGCGAL